MSDSSTNQKTPPMSLVQMLRNVPAAYYPGWGGPEYTNWKDEQMSWKKTCYIGDWSFLWNPLTEGLTASWPSRYLDQQLRELRVLSL